MAAKRQHVILFGPPGAGKSTQASLLMQRWSLVPISTGKQLREEIASGSELGRKVREVLARGELVDDALMVATVEAWLAALPEDKGFLLDGFPRTPAQAEALEAILKQLNRPLTAVVKLELTVSEAVYRLGGRRICYGIGAEEIIHINDESAVEHCLARGGLLVQRPDDLPNVIVRRLAVHEAETEPVISFYESHGYVYTIAAAGSPVEVAQRIIASVESRSEQ